MLLFWVCLSTQYNTTTRLAWTSPWPHCLYRYGTSVWCKLKCKTTLITLTTFSETFFILLPQKLTPGWTPSLLWDHSAWLMGFKEQFQCWSDIRFRNIRFDYLWFALLVVIVTIIFRLRCLNMDVVYILSMYSGQSSIFMLELYNYCIISIILTQTQIDYHRKKKSPIKFHT